MNLSFYPKISRSGLHIMLHLLTDPWSTETLLQYGCSLESYLVKLVLSTPGIPFKWFFFVKLDLCVVFIFLFIFRLNHQYHVPISQVFLSSCLVAREVSRYYVSFSAKCQYGFSTSDLTGFLNPDNDSCSTNNKMNFYFI